MKWLRHFQFSMHGLSLESSDFLYEMATPFSIWHALSLFRIIWFFCENGSSIFILNPMRIMRFFLLPLCHPHKGNCGILQKPFLYLMDQDTGYTQWERLPGHKSLPYHRESYQRRDRCPWSEPEHSIPRPFQVIRVHSPGKAHQGRLCTIYMYHVLKGSFTGIGKISTSVSMIPIVWQWCESWSGFANRCLTHGMSGGFSW